MPNFFIHAFRARCKTAVTLPFVAVFFILSGVIMALGLIFNQPHGLAVRAGVLKPGENAPVARRTLNSLRLYAGVECEIVIYASAEHMKRDVAARRLECAYVFTPAMEARATGGAIEVYRSPGAAAYKVLDMMTAAAYLENFAGVLGQEVLSPFAQSMGIENEGNEISQELQARADKYLSNGALMEMIALDTGGAGYDTAGATPAPYRRLFHGLTGLCGWLLALLCAMGQAGGAEKARMARLTAMGRLIAAYRLAGGAVIGTVTALFMGGTVMLGGMLYPGLTAGWGTELMMGLAYAVCLSGIGLLLSAYIHADIFPALVMLCFIFTALFSGVFFDIREVLAPAGFTRFFFPLYYYLNGVDRAGTEAAALCAAGLAAGALGLRKSPAKTTRQ